ncbi:hypothetical protein QNO00_10640 [Arthrobacter sp. zg-Y1219]|uniref:hypothetical protein n=1 Tax=Arthrobacter sp. zg-Y1219 TaxID=3049067 RepID=UPI0024C35C14|nr:hypothetical protein [Arthrobacter sp. zg-Y1219]MDK1360721.1 hypothetical protein [Arthrobacter sp. zg-Y1219]
MTSGEENQAATFRTAMPARYRGILGGLGFATVAGTVIAALEEGPLALGAGLFIAVIFVPVLLMTARISISEQGIRIRVAAVFATEIPYREITGVSVGPVTGLREGMGLRILPDGTGYLVGGPSVRIECGRTAVLVSCRSPDRLLDALAPHLSAASGS